MTSVVQLCSRMYTAQLDVALCTYAPVLFVIKRQQPQTQGLILLLSSLKVNTIPISYLMQGSFVASAALYSFHSTSPE